MRRCLPLVLGPLAALLVTGCVSMEDPSRPGELTTAEASAPCIGCDIPAITNWSDRTTPSQYFPPGIHHLQTLLTQGDSSATFYAWGVGDGRVLYIHRARKDRFGDYMEGLAQGWNTHEDPSGTTWGIGGSIGQPPPKHPPQPGEPEFSQAYADAVVQSAHEQEEGIQGVIDELGGL
ncbi:MAG TPA: hypothetical protein VK698_29765 [Kofleriaceae bacterium]|nr:hypothetical protein [Kofleriaceae bacterium]